MQSESTAKVLVSPQHSVVAFSPTRCANVIRIRTLGNEKNIIRSKGSSLVEIWAAMLALWALLLSAVCYSALGFAVVPHRLRNGGVLLASTHPSGPGPIVWKGEERGMSNTLSISVLHQMKEHPGVPVASVKRDCFFDHSDECPSSRGGRCKVDGRPCAAQRSYLRPKTFKNPADLHQAKKSEHEDTTTMSARFNAVHDGFIERAERALRGETNTHNNHNNNRTKIQTNHKKVEPRRVQRIHEEVTKPTGKAGAASASAQDLDMGGGDNSYFITNSNVVMMDWQQIKSDLLPNPSNNVFSDTMKVVSNMSERVKKWFNHSFLEFLGPGGGPF